MTILTETPLLAGVSDQTVDVTLDNVPYTLRVLWNERFGYWSLSVNERDGGPILTNIKMVNNYPLVKRFAKLAITGELFFVSRSGKISRPTFEDVGGDYGLFYYDPETPADYPVPNAPTGSTQSVWDLGNSIWDGGTSNWI